MKNITNKGVAFGFVIGLIAVVLIAGTFLGVFESVPKPEIKEGEFNFVLTCEIDKEIKTIDGVYVCKFDGVSKHLDGVSRNWTGYIKNHKDNTSYSLKTTNEGTIKIELDICPEFFMADPHYKANENTNEPKPEPYLYISISDDAETEYKGELYEGNDVKIISFKYDEPIKNKYK